MGRGVGVEARGAREEGFQAEARLDRIGKMLLGADEDYQPSTLGRGESEQFVGRGEGLGGEPGQGRAEDEAKPAVSPGRVGDEERSTVKMLHFINIETRRLVISFQTAIDYKRVGGRQTVPPVRAIQNRSRHD